MLQRCPLQNRETKNSTTEGTTSTQKAVDYCAKSFSFFQARIKMAPEAENLRYPTVRSLLGSDYSGRPRLRNW